MTSAIIGGLLFLGIASIVLLYGKSQKKIGGLTVESEKNRGQQKRESEAKRIESAPPPVTADDVANAWAGMRDVPDNKTE